MGYSTYFDGEIAIDPPLSKEERDFLVKFSETRRMFRLKGPYFVDGGGDFGQAEEEDVADYSLPPRGQPDLWCHWIPNFDGSALEWNGIEKCYASVDWMDYLVEHFLGPNPKAAGVLPFVRPHALNGVISAQGEDDEDAWFLVVKNGEVSRVEGMSVAERLETCLANVDRSGEARKMRAASYSKSRKARADRLEKYWKALERRLWRKRGLNPELPLDSRAIEEKCNSVCLGWA